MLKAHLNTLQERGHSVLHLSCYHLKLESEGKHTNDTEEEYMSRGLIIVSVAELFKIRIDFYRMKMKMAVEMLISM